MSKILFKEFELLEHLMKRYLIVPFVHFYDFPESTLLIEGSLSYVMRRMSGHVKFVQVVIEVL
jgi:hypothetical protein